MNADVVRIAKILGNVGAWPKAHEKFDPELRLADEGTRRVLAGLLARFGGWITREPAAREAERALAMAGQR